MAHPERKGRRSPRAPKETPEFDQQIVDLARVTRVTKGGKQMSFRCCVLIGDKKGRVGYGIQKGKDVQIAVEKAVRQAKKRLITVPLVNDTLPHASLAKFKAAKILLKPAPKGSGIIAGSVIRTVLEMAGVPNASSKMLGKTNNKINNIKATFEALESFLPVRTKRVHKNVSKAQRVSASDETGETKTVAKKRTSSKKQTV